MDNKGKKQYTIYISDHDFMMFEYDYELEDNIALSNQGEIQVIQEILDAYFKRQIQRMT